MAFFVLAGLGNPGSRYENTRHNIGFMLLDYLHVECAGSAWRRKFEADISEVAFGEAKVLLVKPMTFMNLSGGPLRAVAQFFKYAAGDVLVAHDEADLELGTLRLKQGGGSAGHNGIKSIAAELGSEDFFRIRLGIGRPAGERSKMELSSWVLEKFKPGEQEAVSKLLERAAGALQSLRAEGLLAAQNKFHT